MRALIIGGTGFIGPHIARRFLDRGHEVTVLHRGETEADLPAEVPHIHADIASLPDKHNLEADTVIHVCAMTQEDAENALRLFRGRVGKLVVLSSGDVYRAYGVLRGTETGQLEPMPITEDSRLRTALYPYRESMPEYEKILVERTAMSAPDLPACVVRLPVVYGPGDRYHRFLGVVKRMDDNRPAILLGDGVGAWRWTHGYVENIADAIAIAATDPRTDGRIYNLGEAIIPTTAERISMLAAAHGWKGRVAVMPDDKLPAHLRIPVNFKQEMAISSARFRSELGYSDPVSVEQSLDRTIAWERSAPGAAYDSALFDYDAEDRALATAQAQT